MSARRTPASPAAWRARLGPLDLGLAVLVLALDYAFKRFSSHASARELDFLLAPTAACVRFLTGHAFVAETGAGYFSRELLVVIAPVCAGANFAVVAFTALTLGFMARFERPLAKLAWVSAAAGLAYAATVLANSLRIALAIELGQRTLLEGALSGAAAHRAIGVGVYLGALLVLHGGVGLMLGSRKPLLALPLGAYVAVTLVTPLLGGAYASEAFWHHASVVFGATSLAGAVLWLSHRANEVQGTRRDQGSVGDAHVPRGLFAARCGREPALPGQRDSALVPRPLD